MKYDVTRDFKTVHNMCPSKTELDAPLFSK